MIYSHQRKGKMYEKEISSKASVNRSVRRNDAVPGSLWQ